jgi:hypothetical protein
MAPRAVACRPAFETKKISNCGKYVNENDGEPRLGPDKAGNQLPQGEKSTFRRYDSHPKYGIGENI